jgi:hypothetical protein
MMAEPEALGKPFFGMEEKLKIQNKNLNLFLNPKETH